MAAAEVVVVAAAGMRPGFGLRRSVGVLRSRDINTATTTAATATAATAATSTTARTKTPTATSLTARDSKAEAGWQMPRGCPSCRERQQADGGDAPILGEFSGASFLSNHHDRHRPFIFFVYCLFICGLVPLFFVMSRSLSIFPSTQYSLPSPIPAISPRKPHRHLVTTLDGNAVWKQHNEKDRLDSVTQPSISNSALQVHFPSFPAIPKTPSMHLPTPRSRGRGR